MPISQLTPTPKTAKIEIVQAINSDRIPSKSRREEDNTFGVILAIIVLLVIGISIYFFLFSGKKTGKSNFFTDLGDRFQEWSEQSKCAALRKQLLVLVKNQEDVANRLINHAKFKYPGHPEPWYFEKVIYDLRRGR